MKMITLDRPIRYLSDKQHLLRACYPSCGQIKVQRSRAVLGLNPQESHNYVRGTCSGIHNLLDAEPRQDIGTYEGYQCNGQLKDILYWTRLVQL